MCFHRIQIQNFIKCTLSMDKPFIDPGAAHSPPELVGFALVPLNYSCHSLLHKKMRLNRRQGLHS